MREHVVCVGDRSVMIAEAGEPEGRPVLYFHGTPGSRLDLAFEDERVESAGVRLISFDRPGYGRSELAPVSLASLGRDAGLLADELGIDTFATLGWSGGGPYALAAAAVLGDRVTRVGVVSGPGPFQLVPGMREGLGESDLAALALLPDDPAGAAEAFCAGSEGMLAVRDDEEALTGGMAAMLGDGDADVFADPTVRHHLFGMLSEGMRQGFLGVGWDNVAWVGPWDIDLASVRCPVQLWYGALDQMMPLAHGQWLADHLPDARLEVFDGEGHLGLLRHRGTVLAALTS